MLMRRDIFEQILSKRRFLFVAARLGICWFASNLHTNKVKKILQLTFCKSTLVSVSSRSILLAQWKCLQMPSQEQVSTVDGGFADCVQACGWQRIVWFLVTSQKTTQLSANANKYDGTIGPDLGSALRATLSSWTHSELRRIMERACVVEDVTACTW